MMLFGIVDGKASVAGEASLVSLSIADGLAGETVRRVMTDHNGLTWIATSSGVNVYNGRQLQKHPITNRQGLALEVFDLCETRSKAIYAATEGGLFRLTIDSERFEHVLPQIERPIALLAIGDTVFIGSGQGMHIYDGQRLIRKDVGAGHKGLDNIVRCYVGDEQGLIWFLGRHDLNCYNPNTQQISRYAITPITGGRKALTQFALYEEKTVRGEGSPGKAKQKKFFIGSRADGLYVIDLGRQGVRRVPGVGKIVMSVSKSADGLICVATDGAGACLIDPATEQIVSRFTMDAPGMQQLPTNAVYSFYRDKNGVNWFGFVRYGLAYSPHNNRLFRPYAPDGLSTTGMNVRSFLIRGSESLIGLQDGLWYVDTVRHVRRFFAADELGGHIVNNVVWWNGNYYIGMYDGGIRLLDTSTLSLRKQPWNLLLDKTTVGDIRVAPDSSLWIGCADGLFVISRNGSVRRFTEQESNITGGIIISITFDRRGNAWLAGSTGVSFYSAAARDVVKNQFPAGFWNKLPNMRGCLGHDGIVYMRNGPQLFYTTEQMREFGEVALPVRLTDKWCRSMVDDGQGHLALASERGLLYFDYEGRNMAVLGSGEGITGRQISDVQIGSDGCLWVATSNGLLSVCRSDMERWAENRQYQVMLCDIRKGSDLISMKETSLITETREIQLSWNMASEPLQAVPLLPDYARQQGRLYEYRVDGGQWQLIDGNELIDVRSLMLGAHKLEVRLAGANGTLSVFAVTVVPSGWAIVELMLLLGALILLWLWYRYRQNTKVLLTERDEIEKALIEVEDELNSVECETDDAELAAMDEGAGDGSVESSGLSAQPAPLMKYQKVRLDEAECADIVARMKEYIERERVYTDTDLKMKDLADVLRLSTPKLSQVFHLYLQENYYEFINRYRLDEFKRLIEAGEYKRYTITALSQQCGFKKSNFFSTFRKVEGMTPAEYLKKHGVKV